MSDTAVVEMLLAPHDRRLRSALLSKELDPNKLINGYSILNELSWAKAAGHDGFPLPVVAAFTAPDALRLILAAGGDPNAASASGFNCVMAAFVNTNYSHETREAVFKVGAGRLRGKWLRVLHAGGHAGTILQDGRPTQHSRMSCTACAGAEPQSMFFFAKRVD